MKSSIVGFLCFVFLQLTTHKCEGKTQCFYLCKYSPLQINLSHDGY